VTEAKVGPAETSRVDPADPIDGLAMRAQFPLLSGGAGDRPLVYLDSAATSQKPRVVLDAMQHFYETTNANVHRGVYEIAERATAMMEDARARTARFIGAESASEIVFTKNASEALNLVVHSWGRTNLGPGDAVVLTHMEHHSNIVPWQILAAERGFEIRWIPLTPEGQLDLTDLDRLLDGAKAVGVSAMSNVLGTLTPVNRVTEAAHAHGAVVVVDACQYVPHHGADVGSLDADFLAFSAHKMCGPTGIGVLWGRETLLDAMPPFLGGGEMIRDVRLDGFTPNDLPWKFEAGTPPIAESIGLGAAVEFLEGVGMPAIREHEVRLTAYALRLLTERFGDRIRLHGPSEPSERGGVISFEFDHLHPHDVAQVLDQHGVCVRAGHHCAKPLMRVLDVQATARASVYLYNTESDLDALADALDSASDFFAL
jgi:cysteine desulfurase/selenocysteine lyase